MKLTQYDNEILETWRTSRLGSLYMTGYVVSRADPEECSQLERVARILSTRPQPERVTLLNEIKTRLRGAQREKDGEQTESLFGMLNHYIGNVMQPEVSKVD